jgi:hypothetical protein
MKGADVGKKKWAALLWPRSVELGDMTDSYSRWTPKDEEVQSLKNRWRWRICSDI